MVPIFAGQVWELCDQFRFYGIPLPLKLGEFITQAVIYKPPLVLGLCVPGVVLWSLSDTGQGGQQVDAKLPGLRKKALTGVMPDEFVHRRETSPFDDHTSLTALGKAVEGSRQR
jgi:hypothetical protein